MKKQDIWISDLTHTAQGISAATFPLGVSFVLSYAKQKLGNEFNFKLFKFPSRLAEALRDKLPKMICFSNYSWNFELAYKFAYLVKQKNPNVVTVFGGPNFPTHQGEMSDFLKRRPAIDFYIELEGELAFVNLVKRLIDYDFNIVHLKQQDEKILNTSYLYDGRMICGSKERIKDINDIPSPYLTGLLDEYFDFPLSPLLETTRGCPFTCTFCSDGAIIKNKVRRFDPQRTKEELKYIAKKISKVDELCITDLNFSMYKQDITTAKMIADVQQTYNYPTVIQATTGKNMPDRAIEVAKIVKGWSVGGSVQSTDPDVLKSIKRSNISTSAYRKVMDFANSRKNEKTSTEIILGLPGDTKEKHFESLRYGIDNNAKQIRMYQAMLLIGTDMATKDSRKKFELKTKFRLIPGCIGNYDIFGKKHSIAEIEEIIVGSNTISTDDYVDCRIMNLIIEAFYNNSIFEEAYATLMAIGVSSFDCLRYIKEHPELYSERIKQILKSFVTETSKDLFDSFDEANQYVLSPKIINSYIGGEMGNNELLWHRALLFEEFKDICDLMFESINGVLKEKNLLSNKVKDYLDDLKKFTFMRKNDSILNTESIKSVMFRYDFETIEKIGFFVDPNTNIKLKIPVQYDFYHKQNQKKHISNQVALFSKTPVGLGRLLSRANMKLIFRHFVKSRKTKYVRV